MNTTTQTIDLKKSDATQGMRAGYFARRTVWDWIFAVLCIAGGIYAYVLFSEFMNGYEIAILIGTVPSLIALAWFWSPLRQLTLVVAVLSLLAVWLYQVDGVGMESRAESVFLLKYFLSSQSAILWMSVLFFMSTGFYWLGIFSSEQNADGFESIGSKLAWVAVTLALVGSFVRWYESYLMGPDIGYIPVSNLYEVFILFAWLTAAYYLYYEDRYQTRRMGAFAMLIVAASVGFLLWYTLVREAHEIKPLVPALQSWWMKVHVPANFVGYGTFAIAAMLAFAYLIKESVAETRWWKLAPLWLLGVVLCFEPLIFRQGAIEGGISYWAMYFGISAFIVAGIMMARRRIAARLPSLEVMDDVMYKAIAVGFAFFTIATILGALWAAEAWGGYWSWDPKETWALIVWLNYAAWLHMRLMKGLRGTVAAWWALVGLVITTFAFLGVNIFLSGLHSYGEL
jgi:cytochrome c-type biogenesis protein CcsB